MREVKYSLTFGWVLFLIKRTRLNGTLRFHDIAPLLPEDMRPLPIWYAARHICNSWRHFNPALKLFRRRWKRLYSIAQRSSKCRGRINNQAAWSAKFRGGNLLSALVGTVKCRFYTLLLVKLTGDALSFVAPLVLGDLVTCIASSATFTLPEPSATEAAPPAAEHRYLAQKSESEALPGSVQRSVGLAGLLCLVAVLKAVIDAQYNYHLNRMAITAQGAIMEGPLNAALRKPTYIRKRFSYGAVPGPQVHVWALALQWSQFGACGFAALPPG
jgi:hypothetical protein